MSKGKANADKAPQVITEEQNAPSVEQVNIQDEVKSVQAEDQLKEVETEDQADKAPQVVTIEMGFKDDEPQPNENDVKFKIEYSKNFEGKKRHVEGSFTIISKELAKEFEEKGIGHIVK